MAEPGVARGAGNADAARAAAMRAAKAGCGAGRTGFDAGSAVPATTVAIAVGSAARGAPYPAFARAAA
ncbi:hypothetical protein L810_4941 [Burkholderia sp. AU4i]|nr:hypothetical protein L810_4941 [Burkholderia sp. AU4i]